MQHAHFTDDEIEYLQVEVILPKVTQEEKVKLISNILQAYFMTMCSS